MCANAIPLQEWAEGLPTEQLYTPDGSTNGLPELIPPDGYGYMPLFCAAQWIATEGGRRTFDPIDNKAWRPAFSDLLAVIASEAVRVVGISGHEKKPVPSYLFAGIRVYYPYSDPTPDMFLSDELVLHSSPYVDEEHWLKGPGDVLEDRRGMHWRRLVVERSGVRALRSFYPQPETKVEAPPKHPGRTPKYDWDAMIAELVRWADKEGLPKSQRAVGKYLADWYAAKNGGEGPNENTVRNRLSRYLVHLPEDDDN